MQHSDGPVTLIDVLAELRRAKVFIAVGIVLACALALLFLGAATPLYRAEMIVGPANPISNDEAASTAAGVHPARNTNANALNFMRFETTLAGPAVAGMLLKDEKIFEGLTTDSPMGLFRAPVRWTPRLLSDYIGRRVRIEPVGETPLRRLVYFYPSPEFAAYFLAQLQDADDALIRRNIRAEAAGRVDYLQKAAATIINPDHRRALTGLLMLASVDQPYAATVIEPASSSAAPEWPGRALIIAAFTLAGALAGFILHGFRRAA